MEAIGLLRSISGVGSCVGGGNRCLARALTPPFALGENTKRGGWGEHGEHRDGVKAIANGEWLEFTWEAAKIVLGQVPLVKALGVANQLRDLLKIVDKIDNLLGEIGEAAIERSWGIIKNSPIRFSADALKYVDDIKLPKFGVILQRLIHTIPILRRDFQMSLRILPRFIMQSLKRYKNNFLD
jgi:hypothetical protein